MTLMLAAIGQGMPMTNGTPDYGLPAVPRRPHVVGSHAEIAHMLTQGWDMIRPYYRRARHDGV